MAGRPGAIVAVLILAALGAGRPAHAADAGFTQFIASLWPEAQAAGVSRATFDAETRGLEPDYKLPDLILPGRPATGAPGQAEFVQVPADYVKEASIARLAVEGQKLMQKHRVALDQIESSLGVPATVVLAIWGRETDYGRYRLPYDTLRVVATQAYVGRRKDQYRTEFILALKILGEGAVTRNGFRSSWSLLESILFLRVSFFIVISDASLMIASLGCPSGCTLRSLAISAHSIVDATSRLIASADNPKNSLKYIKTRLVISSPKIFRKPNLSCTDEYIPVPGYRKTQRCNLYIRIFFLEKRHDFLTQEEVTIIHA